MCIRDRDYIVLNSVANVPKALYPWGSYERIHCFFDNDRAGMEAIQQSRKEYDATRYIRDASQIYSGCKDPVSYTHLGCFPVLLLYQSALFRCSQPKEK